MTIGIIEDDSLLNQALEIALQNAGYYLSLIHIFWGDYALFSRPELKVERYSYDVMTPSAARGILEAIYWHPGMRWIDVYKRQIIRRVLFCVQQLSRL